MKKSEDGGYPTGGKNDSSLLKGLVGRSPSFEDGSGVKPTQNVGTGLVRSGVGSSVPQLGPRQA